MSKPHTLIHVRNLQSNLPISIDAWGRPSPSQPVLISLSVSLHHPFTSSSSTDTVASSTIHYGLLSKSVLKFCEGYTARVQNSRNQRREAGQDGWQQEIYLSLEQFVNVLASHLFSSEGVLTKEVVESLRLEVVLVKASLMGSGVVQERVFGSKGEMRGSVLGLRDLRIACLIGVNPNEREAKQVVVANVGLEEWYFVGEDRWKEGGGDLFVGFERVVVAAIADSSFQTLEALTTHITQAIIRDFLLKLVKEKVLRGYPRIRILLEKPTAVTWADAPGVEVLVETNPTLNESVKSAWEQK